MTNSELRNMTIEELSEHVDMVEKQLRQMRFLHAVSPLQNPMQIKYARREVSRSKTLLQEKVEADIIEKMKSGEVNTENVHEFLGNNKYPISFGAIKLAKLMAKAKASV